MPRVEMLPKGLAAWRATRSMTQYELARRVGCSDTLIALIETGRRQPGYDNALAIAAALDIDLEAFAIVVGDPEAMSA